MDKNDLTALRIDLMAQMTLVEATIDKLEARAGEMQADDPGRLESVAYQLHNLYNAIEELFKLVAAHFENHIASPAHWHTELLYRMTQPIAGVRPALLSEESYLWLNSLRGFRHFSRHAYNVPIEYEQLQLNLTKTRQFSPRLKQDVNHFLQQLSGEKP